MLWSAQTSAHSLQSENEQLRFAVKQARIQSENLRSPPSCSNSLIGTSAGSLDINESGDRDLPLLGVGATWDLIQSHPLVKQGSVDPIIVLERLRSMVKCFGRGTVFNEEKVRNAIEDAPRSDRDEL